MVPFVKNGQNKKGTTNIGCSISQHFDTISCSLCVSCVCCSYLGNLATQLAQLVEEQVVLQLT